MKVYCQGKVALFLAAMVLLSACTASQRIENANTFAAAGIAYADALPPALDESFSAAVANNSLQLELTRDGLDSVDRREEAVLNANEQMEERYEVMIDLKNHARLLKRYFTALKALAQVDGATGITTETNNVVAALGGISPKIKDAEIGGLPLSDAIAPAVDLAVGAYKSAVIKSELEAHGETIERELALQETALRLLVDQTISDRSQIIEVRQILPLAEVYASSRPLPSNWADRREAAFRAAVDVSKFETALKAVSNLRQSWIALVENRLDQAAILTLIEDVNEFVDLATSIADN